MRNVRVRVFTSAGPRCRGCTSSLAQQARARGSGGVRHVHCKNAHASSGKSVSTGAPLSLTGPHRLLHQVLSLKLCPKAITHNIPEYVVLREVL